MNKSELREFFDEYLQEAFVLELVDYKLSEAVGEESKIDINVNNLDYGIEPIDSLQALFDNWFVFEHPFSNGDVDRDSVISILDLLIILDFSLGDQVPSYFQSFPSDFDENNIINIGDVFYLTNFLLSQN